MNTINIPTISELKEAIRDVIREELIKVAVKDKSQSIDPLLDKKQVAEILQESRLRRKVEGQVER